MGHGYFVDTVEEQEQRACCEMGGDEWPVNLRLSAVFDPAPKGTLEMAGSRSGGPSPGKYGQN